MSINAINALAQMALSRAAESTTTASMPSGTQTQVLQVNTTADKPKRFTNKLVDLMRKRRGEKVAEDEVGGIGKPVIPSDAQQVQSVAPDKQNVANQQPKTPGIGVEDVLSVAMALVAPDTTPDAELVLDPSLVPAPIATEPIVSNPDASDDALRTLLNVHQKSFKPTEIVNPATAGEALNQSLHQVPTSATVAGAQKQAADLKAGMVAQGKAAAAMEAAMNGTAQKIPTINVDASMRKTSAAVRAIYG